MYARFDYIRLDYSLTWLTLTSVVPIFRKHLLTLACI